MANPNRLRLIPQRLTETRVSPSGAKDALVSGAAAVTIFAAGKLLDVGLKTLNKRLQGNPGPKATGYPDGTHGGVDSI